LDFGHQLLKYERGLTATKEDSLLSNDEINFESSNNSNEKMETMADDVANVEESNLFLLDESKEVEELMDDGLNFLCNKNGNTNCEFDP
jgi:hypothetical protein